MTQPTSHPPAEELAAHAAGEAGGAVATHVAACAVCSADVAAIGRVTRELVELPGLRMPQDVISSLAAALDAERAGAPSSSLTTARALRSRRAGLLPYAAAAAVVAVAMIGVTSLRDDSARDADKGADRAVAAAPEVVAQPRLLHSGTDYTPGSLDAQVQGALSGPAADAAALSDSAAGTGPSVPAPAGAAPQRYAEKTATTELTPEQLQSCVDELSGQSGVAPLVVDFATFQQQPAVIVVLPFRESRVDVFVVRPTCRLGNAELLHFQRVATSAG